MIHRGLKAFGADRLVESLDLLALDGLDMGPDARSVIGLAELGDFKGECTGAVAGFADPVDSGRRSFCHLLVGEFSSSYESMNVEARRERPDGNGSEQTWTYSCRRWC